MRIFSILLLLISFSMTNAYAQDAKKDEHPDPEPKSFKEAYAGYNEAVKAKDVHLTTHYAQRAYEFGFEKFGAEHTNTLNLALNWMKSYNIHSKGHDSSELLIKEIFPYFEKSPKTEPATLIETYLASANYLIQIPQMKSKHKSLTLFRKAIRIVDREFKDNDHATAAVYLEVGEALYSQGSKEAKKYFLKAQKLYGKDPIKNKVSFAISNFWIAKSLLTSRSYIKAAEAMSLALNTFDEVAPSSHYALTGHAFMIQILEKQGLRDEATKHCQLIGKAQPMNVNQEQKPLYRFAPNYPRTRLTGDVIVEFTVDEEGFVKNPRAIDGENVEIFSKSVLKAIKDFRFAPRYENGNPVSTDGLKIRFTFSKAIRG